VSTVPGEDLRAGHSPSTFAPRLRRQLLNRRYADHAHSRGSPVALEQFKTFRSRGQFFPFSVDKQDSCLPGFDGGAEWGGPAVDPAPA